MKDFLIKILKGNIFSTLSGLITLLIFSGIFSLTGSNKFMLISVNIIIRILSAFIFAKFLCEREKGILFGLLSGFLSFLNMELIFMIFGGVNFNITMLIELAFSLVFGMISGIIFVNLKNNPVNS